MMSMGHIKGGFTLIELLVVIAIIGILSTIAMTSLNGARRRARDATRVSDLNEIQKAVELYYSTNGSYPNTSGSWRSECAAWGSYANNNVVPGIVPAHMASLPRDPNMDTVNSKYCYVYRSDGTDYAILDLGWTTAIGAEDLDPKIAFAAQPALVDPVRDGGTVSCSVEITSHIRGWKVSSDGAKCW